MRGENPQIFPILVTVNRVSYTVINTFFFHEGKIHCILNKLEKLSTIDYTGNGTALMVVRVLNETLGLTNTKLARILKHFVYDGVYADNEERVAGGGCLELKKNVSEILGLESNSLTGN